MKPRRRPAPLMGYPASLGDVYTLLGADPAPLGGDAVPLAAGYARSHAMSWIRLTAAYLGSIPSLVPRIRGRPQVLGTRQRYGGRWWLLCTLAALAHLLAVGPKACHGQQVLGMVEKFEREEEVALKGQPLDGQLANGQLSDGQLMNGQLTGGQPANRHPPERMDGDLIPQRAWKTFPAIGLATFSAYRVRPEVYVLLAHVLKPHLDGPLALKDKNVTCSIRSPSPSGGGRGRGGGGGREGGGGEGRVGTRGQGDSGVSGRRRLNEKSLGLTRGQGDTTPSATNKDSDSDTDTDRGSNRDRGSDSDSDRDRDSDSDSDIDRGSDSVLQGELHVDATVDFMHPGAWIFTALFCHFPNLPKSEAPAPPLGLGQPGEVLELRFGTHVVAAIPEDATPVELDPPQRESQDTTARRRRLRRSLLGSQSGEASVLPPTGPARPSGAEASSASTASSPSAAASAASESESLSLEKELPAKQLLNFCSPPIFGDALLRTVTDWVVYHQHYIGFDHLFFYLVLENKEEWAQGLGKFLSPEEFTVLEFGHPEELRSWAHAQALAINDCVNWNRRQAHWVAFGDFDEYIFVQNLPPFNSLRHFLRNNASACSEVNRGSIFFGLFCNGTLWDSERDSLAVELLEYKRDAPQCSTHFRTFPMNASHCTDWWGHRKSIVRTDAVYLGGVHTVYTPPFPAFPTVQMCNMSAFDIHNAHYHGFARASATCGDIPEMPPPGYHRTRAVADIARGARLCRDPLVGSQEKGNCSSWRRH